MYKHILIPTDGSPLSDNAVEHGLTLAAALGSRVTILTVTEPFHIFALNPAVLTDTAGEYHKHMETRAGQILSQASAMAKAHGVAATLEHVEDPHPSEAIIRAAGKAGCDVIVMASHGRRGASAVLLGSETMRVLTSSKIPVIVCR